jgi:hypothetical protein
MVKALLQIALGFALALGGFYVGFIALQGLADSSAFLPWLMLLSLPLIAGGGFFLYRGGKSEATLGWKKAKVNLDLTPPDKSTLEETIEKNNAMDKDWAKTNDARNRLKMLQLSADAQKSG